MRATLLVLVLALSGALGLASPASAEQQRGTIKMRDGRVFEDVVYEVRGQKVWVKRSLGEVTYDMAQIAQILPTEDEGPDVGAAEIDRPGADWLARFQLEPPEDWNVVTPSLPAVRAQLRHRSRDAVLRVRVTPIEKPFTFLRGEEREVSQRLREDLERLYERVVGSKVEVSQLHANPVYRLTGASARPYGAESKDSDRLVEEVRFQRLGLEYALSYEVAKTDAGALETGLEELFRCFSFLPALVIEEGLYADLSRGFALSTLPEWKSAVRPFDELRPLSLENPDGRATLEVEVLVGTNAERVVEERINKLGQTSKVKVEQVTLNGAEVVAFSFNGFKPGGRSLLGYRGYAAVTGGQIVILTGIAPLSDSDSSKLVSELESMLASFRARNVERLTAQARKARAALELLAQANEAASKHRTAEAIQRLGEAIEAEPTFALAYYLRGLARKQSSDFQGYKEDLTKADELAPGAGYAKDLAGALADEAAQAHRQKDWAKSMELHKRLLSSGAGDAANARQRLLDAGRSRLGEMRKKKNFDEWKEIDSALRDFKDDDELQKGLLRLLEDCARELQRAGDSSEAKRVMRSAKRVLKGLRRDKDYEKLRASYEKLESELERKR